MKKNAFIATVIFVSLLCVPLVGRTNLPTPDGKKDESRKMQNFLDQVSKGILKLSKSYSFRKILYEEVGKHFDGEYNILIRDLYSRCKEKGFDIVDEMEDCLLLNGERAYGLRENLFKAVKGYRTQEGNTLYPHIYIPAFENRVDYLQRMESDEIIVVTDRVVPDGKKFYGKKIDDDLRVNPTDFVVEENDANEKEIWVIAFNERADSNAKLKTMNVDEPANADACQGNMVGAIAARQVNVSTIKCLNLSALESWTRGGPELWLVVFDKNKAEFSKQYFHMKRSQINNVWYTVNRWIGYWAYDTSGDALYFSWYKEDGGSQTLTITIGFKIKETSPTIGITFKIGSEDDYAGGQIVHSDYYDAPYNTGLIEWRVY